MKKLVHVALLAALALAVSGCKKRVPDDIVKKTITSAMRMHAAGLVTSMCGGSSKGLSSPSVTITRRDGENAGMVHVKGSPTFFQGKTTPSQCEGDIEFAYTYTSKTIGAGSRRRTLTTWYLQHMKLVAIQTPGVQFKPFEEDPEGDDDEQ